MAEWFKCKGGVWCELYKLNLDHDYFAKSEGVFVIWAGMDDKKIIMVGSGNIKKKLEEAKNDHAVTAFIKAGVFVSWIEVSMLKRNSAEVFLHNTLTPLITVNKPKGIPMKVNLPWDDD